MRVLLNKCQSNPTDGGAIAIIVALLTTVIFLLAGFATDFGMAYTSKRDLQNSADAAALSAAQTFANGSGNCDALRSALSSSAQTTADSIAQQNVAGFAKSWQRNEWNVMCPGDVGRVIAGDKGLEVAYGNQAITPTTFGALAGISSIAASRRAVASVFVPDSLTGLRPYMICIGDAQRVQANPATIQRVDFPSCGNAPGNWYTVECPPPDDGNGNPVLANNTENGCSSPVNIVDTSSANGDPAQIVNLLKAACNGVSKTSDGLKGCMVADTGNDMTSKNVRDAWNTLLGKVIVLPVFDPNTVVGNGSNAKYPVKAMIAVRVCGYQWQSGKANGSVTTGDCAGTPSPLPSGSDYLYLRYSHWIASGSSVGTKCQLGDPNCDFGVRGISLVQ